MKFLKVFPLRKSAANLNLKLQSSEYHQSILRPPPPNKCLNQQTGIHIILVGNGKPALLLPGKLHGDVEELAARDHGVPKIRHNWLTNHHISVRINSKTK